jgi:hypothetical protein
MVTDGYFMGVPKTETVRSNRDNNSSKPGTSRLAWFRIFSLLINLDAFFCSHSLRILIIFVRYKINSSATVRFSSTRDKLNCLPQAQHRQLEPIALSLATIILDDYRKNTTFDNIK